MLDYKELKRKRKRSIYDRNVNRLIVRPLIWHMTHERKQLESLIYGLRAKLYLDVERVINDILGKISETEHSVELIAQELGRQNNHNE